MKLGYSLPIVLGLLHFTSKPTTGQGLKGLSATVSTHTITNYP